MRYLRRFLPALAALALAGCASGPNTGATTSPTPTPAAFKACIVADESGFGDGGDNQQAYNAVMQAATDLRILVGQAQADDQTDYASAIASLAGEQCSAVIAVGSQHAAEVQAAAKANPDVEFLLVDAQPAEPQPNLKPLLFDPADAAFLAGYVAAAQATGSNVTVAEQADEPYRNGFDAGVDYFNQTKNADIEVVADSAATEGVRKMVDAAVITALGESVRGEFSSVPYYGTLKDGGVDIVPLDASASDELKADVETVRAALIDGSITPPAAG